MMHDGDVDSDDEMTADEFDRRLEAAVEATVTRRMPTWRPGPSPLYTVQISEGATTAAEPLAVIHVSSKTTAAAAS